MTENEGFIPSLSHVYMVHGGLITVCCVVLFFVAPTQLPAFAAGAALTTLNFTFLVGMWRGILEKKPIARTMTLVVFKYAILGTVLFIFVKVWKLPFLSLMAGLSTLVGTVLIVALQTQILDKRN